MKSCMPSALLLISLVSYSVLTEDQSVGSDQMPQANASDPSGPMSPSRGSWESWLRHGAHNSITTSPITSLSSSHNVGLAASNAFHVPSVRRGPGFIGPEPADIPSRLRFDTEMGRSDAGSGNGRR